MSSSPASPTMIRRATMLAAAALLTACGGGGGGASPQKHALGTEVSIEYTSSPSASTPATTTTLGVTVLSVQTGTQEQLSSAGFRVEDKDKDATPYYVHVRYANKGTTAVPRQLDVGLEDAKDNSVPTLLVTGIGDQSFELCNDASSSSPLAPGDSYESCTMFLVPKGMGVDRVRFVSQGADAKITFTDWAAT